jgi:large subunit ribosomal protein L9
MKVILRKNIESLGEVGQLVSVKDGYALNYLIPRQYAYLATQGSIRALEEEKKLLAKTKKREVESASKTANELDTVQLTIPMQVGEEDKLFGSVTTQMIADALKERGFDVDKRKIEMDEPIKTLGIFSVSIKLHAEVAAHIKVWVVRE